MEIFTQKNQSQVPHLPLRLWIIQVHVFGISCVLYCLSCILVMKGRWYFCMNSASKSQIFSFCFVWWCQKSQLDLAVSHLACFSFLLSRIQWPLCSLNIIDNAITFFFTWLGALTCISKLMTSIFSSFLCTHLSCPWSRTLLSQSSHLHTLSLPSFL